MHGEEFAAFVAFVGWKAGLACVALKSQPQRAASKMAYAKRFPRVICEAEVEEAGG